MDGMGYGIMNVEHAERILSRNVHASFHILSHAFWHSVTLFINSVYLVYLFYFHFQDNKNLTV